MASPIISMPAPIQNVGGQAVIEGVMMRAGAGVSVAVRRPSGEIVIRANASPTLGERFPIFKLPLLRGVVVLVETLLIGVEALGFSAEQVEAKAGDPVSAKPTGSNLGTSLSLAIALIAGLTLFVALPHSLSILAGMAFGGFALESPVFHIVAGAFKLGIFVGYLALLSLLKDVRRVFMYHGAEHKVIATFEANEPLDVEHARTHTTFHARCGTSFLLVVVVVAIVVFAMLLPLLGLKNEMLGHVTAVLIKVPLLLPIAALAYELNRYAAKHLNNPLVRLFVAPGFLMQRLTTREPTDEMLEVALASLVAALKQKATGSVQAANVAIYQDFADVTRRVV